MPEIKDFHIHGLSRREEVVIHRLRIGHTRLTHSYLMEGKTNPPVCPYCNNAELTVKHIMIDCTHFKYTRRNHYRAPDMKFLFDNISLRKIIDFLKEARLYSLL